MKVALATWNGRISPVFDVARQVLLLDVEEGRVVARCEETLRGTEPQAQANRMATLARVDSPHHRSRAPTPALGNNAQRRPSG
jgi:predicted Fe-Mo cluster-binding NifX family protein